MLELTVRRDGSSNFSPENKWANFPSVSAGWNLTNEKFMENRPSWFTRAKIRASWGMNGNQNIGTFAYTSMMQGTAGYMLGIGELTALAPGLVPSAYSNAALKWEESVQTDIGLDIGLWDNALSLSLDYYDKRTNGMLMTMSLPSYIGNNRPWGNVGNMKNSGFEFDITWKHSVGDFNYSVGLNGSYNKNVLLQLGNETGYENYDTVLGTLGTISRGQNGLPFPFFYGWKTDGIFQSDREADAYRNAKGERLQPYALAGDVKFVDLNKDGVIDDADRTMIGKGMPDWTFGFNLSASWKGFDFSALFSATLGNDIYDATRRTDYPLVNMQSFLYEERWHGAGTSNRLPRITADADGGKNLNWRSSDLMVYDGSFLRCRSMVLGYTVPQHLTRKALISKLRVYLSAENLFTLTSYHGMDPEIASGGTSLGIDRGVYPQARTFSAGINLTF
jgi:TonB-linked SusC/RagA family outer membrane protein